VSVPAGATITLACPAERTEHLGLVSGTLLGGG